MTPPIFALCSADTSLDALLRGVDNVFRLFAFGEATERTEKPYAVWQLVGGAPENYLGTAPDIDGYELQIDVYADTAATARVVATTIQSVVESVAHVTRYNGEWRDTSTRDFVCSFTVDWFVER